MASHQSSERAFFEETTVPIFIFALLGIASCEAMAKFLHALPVTVYDACILLLGATTIVGIKRIFAALISARIASAAMSLGGVLLGGTITGSCAPRLSQLLTL